MAKIARIYTSGIGAKVARFSPLMVDFRNGQWPDDAIVWLRNGGGKPAGWPWFTPSSGRGAPTSF